MVLNVLARAGRPNAYGASGNYSHNLQGNHTMCSCLDHDLLDAA